MKATRAPYLLVSGQSMTGDSTSAAYSVSDIDLQALQIDYSGSPNGSFKIQGSCNHVEDNLGNILVAGTWADMYFSVNGAAPAASVAVPANPSPIIFDIDGSAVSYLRVVYTHSSGTGSYSVSVVGKRLGD